MLGTPLACAGRHIITAYARPPSFGGTGSAYTGTPIAKTFVSFGSIREVDNMNIFAYRKHLWFLTPIQRRHWWDQRKRLTPRVPIGGGYLPLTVSRAFAYAKIG